MAAAGVALTIKRACPGTSLEGSLATFRLVLQPYPPFLVVSGPAFCCSRCCLPFSCFHSRGYEGSGVNIRFSFSIARR
jgi:hypothetical protein